MLNKSRCTYLMSYISRGDYIKNSNLKEVRLLISWAILPIDIPSPPQKKNLSPNFFYEFCEFAIYSRKFAIHSHFFGWVGNRRCNYTSWDKATRG